MASAPARFNFDLDLGDRGERGRMMTDGAIADLAKAASAEGYDRGFSDGERSATAARAKELSTAVEKLVSRATAMQSALEKGQKAAIADASELAFAVGRKLAHHLIAREPAAELQALVEECLGSLEAVPHLVIRCHPDIAEDIKQGVEARALVDGFTGKLVVIADPDLGISDGRIEWADGGITRDTAALTAQLDQTIAAFLDGRRANPAQEQKS